MPFIILRAKSSEIRKAIQNEKGSDIKHGVFINTMTGGTYQQQIDYAMQTNEEDLVYYAAVLFGNWDTVRQITKKVLALQIGCVVL